MSDLSSVLAVLHEKNLKLLHVWDNELLEAIGEDVSGFLVASIANLWHWEGTLEATTNARVNTSGSSPCHLKNKGWVECLTVSQSKLIPPPFRCGCIGPSDDVWSGLSSSWQWFCEQAVWLLPWLPRTDSRCSTSTTDSYNWFIREGLRDGLVTLRSCWAVWLTKINFIPGKVKAHELRNKGRSDLLKQLGDLKKELGELRVAKVTGGAASKLSKMWEECFIFVRVRDLVLI